MLCQSALIHIADLTAKYLNEDHKEIRYLKEILQNHC